MTDKVSLLLLKLTYSNLSLNQSPLDGSIKPPIQKNILRLLDQLKLKKENKEMAKEVASEVEAAEVAAAVDVVVDSAEEAEVDTLAKKEKKVVLTEVATEAEVEETTKEAEATSKE